MSVNAVHLIGLVAARPLVGDDGGSCQLLVMTDADDGRLRQRHRVHLFGRLVDAAQRFGVGERVYVRGRLGRLRGRPVIVARELWSVQPAPELAGYDEPESTHASPAEHERREHVRRVGVGTARERLVRVRATIVHGRGRHVGGGNPAV